MATSDKKILFGKEAREKLLEGCKVMYDSVGSTYSIAGRLVAIERRWNYPKAIADGVEVAREVSHTDPFVTMGIDMIREAAERQVIECGDGTSVTTILSYHLVDEALKMINDGVAPFKLRNELNALIPTIREEIGKMAIPSTKDKDIEHVATISSTSEEIGKLVAQAVKEVGEDGQLSVEESKTGETYLEKIEGMSFDKGYSNPYFATNERAEAVVRDPLVVVLPKKVTLVGEIAPILQVMAKLNGDKNFLFVGDISGDALAGILQNKMQGNMNALVVDVPGHGERRRHFLEDIALVSGARLFPEQYIGLDYQNLLNKYQTDPQKASWFGVVKTVITDSKATTIVPKEVEDGVNREDRKIIEQIKKDVTTKVNSLRAQLKKQDQLFEREHLEERIAKLTTGVAVIKVGAKTEVEMREKIERVKDAIGAARSVSEGVLPGGGVAMWKLSDLIPVDNDGGKLLSKTLKEPMQKLLSNAGFTGANYKVEDNLGWNINKNEMSDLVKDGVIDPAKVIRLAIENAISVAGTIMMSDTLISISREKPAESGKGI